LSFYHAAPGLHAVRTLISLAQGDTPTAANAIADYCDAAGQASDEIDATMGCASVLIGTSLLLRALPPLANAERLQLRKLGDTLADWLNGYLATEPSMGASTSPRWLGIAHGWAGVLFAGLAWSEATGASPAPRALSRLEELADMAFEVGSGLCWPQQTGLPVLERPPATGWCHGSAGYALLWAAAYRVTGTDEHLELAERAALYAHDQGTATGASLCCGLAGQAYACLSVHRLTGDDAWVRRAHRLAARAGDRARGRQYRNNSLYTGNVGVGLLAADLTEPESSHMPLFESDRWPLDVDVAELRSATGHFMDKVDFP
jgi:serine/threonine-protein kinase